MKLVDQVLSGLELRGVGTTATTKLVHPLDRFRWTIRPFLSLIVEEVDVPGWSSRDASICKRLADQMCWERIIEVLDLRIRKTTSDLASCPFVVVESRHLNPYNAHADVGFRKLLQH